jgi:type I restriction enzyme M protein
MKLKKTRTKKAGPFKDIQRDAHEHLLSEIAQVGKNGQFRPPRHIINLIAELVQPQLG